MLNTAFRTTAPKSFTIPSPFHVLNEVLNTAADEFYHSYHGNVQKRPAINIKETENTFEIALAAPGLNKEDFNLGFEKGSLTVSVKKEVTNKEGERIIRKEFGYEDFSHSFKLSEVLNTETINASYNAGILTIVLEKKPVAAPQKIKIS